MRKYLVCQLLFLFCNLLHLNAQISLVKDINHLTNYGCSFADKIIYDGNIYVSGKLYSDQDTFNHIFKYDVTSHEFSKCFDVMSVDGPFFAFVYNNYLYYYTTDSFQNWTLWKTDGTAAMNQVIMPNMKISFTITDVTQPVVYNGKLYFIGNNSANGTELWVTDGTTSGTQIVKDIKLGGNGSNPAFLTVYNNKIYFSADDGITGTELWISDGTNSGTNLLKDIYTGFYSGAPTWIKEINGKLVFSSTTMTNGKELWVSDGTTIGTNLLMDLNPGPNGSDPLNFYFWNNKLYFAADSAYVRKIYETDGTAIGTQSLFNPTPGNSIVGILQPFNNQILFIGHNITYGNELWRTDGTLAGTFMVKDIAPSTYSSNPYVLVTDTLNNGLVIAADNDTSAITSNVELWFTDGTNAGTNLIKDINNKPSSTIINGNRLLLNNKIYFEANDSVSGLELYVTDGTTSGTNLYIDAETRTEASSPTFLLGFQNHFFFPAKTSDLGTELWVTDGTSSGTNLVEDLNIGSGSTHFRYMDTLNGGAYIFVRRAQDEIRKVNSSFNGTTVIKSMNQTMSFYPPINYNNKLYFTGPQDSSISINMPYNTWITDGTTAGTYANLPFVIISSIVYNNKILFYGMDSTQDSELWISDGTIGGTQLVKNINATTNSEIKYLTLFNGLVYFIATDLSSGESLWKSDGTLAGTVLVKDLNPTSSSAEVYGMQACGNKLYLYVNYPQSGATKLWVSDGTSAGTNFINTTIPGLDFTSVLTSERFFYEYNGEAYFWIYNWLNPSSSDGFWKSDGTSAGTYLLKQGYPYYGDILTHNGIMYMALGNSSLGLELYRSDGTVSGTFLVQDKIPGVIGLYPSNFKELNNSILMTGLGAETGMELFSYCADYYGIASVSGYSEQRLKACEGIYNLSPCEKICEVTNAYSFDNDEIKAHVWIDNLLGNNYVSRRYELKNNPVEFNNMGRLTLYFKQSEFDSYNSLTNYYVPFDSLDIQNYKSNIVVAHYADTSVGETGLINSYNASTLSFIDPVDSNIKWNSNLHCWEITFDYIQGYGGFFIKGLNPLNTSSTQISSPKVYPNPVNASCIVDIGDDRTIHEAVLLDLLGNSIKQFPIHSNTNKLDLDFLKSGVYILKVGNSFYTKLIKQ